MAIFCSSCVLRIKYWRMQGFGFISCIHFSRFFNCRRYLQCRRERNTDAEIKSLTLSSNRYKWLTRVIYHSLTLPCPAYEHKSPTLKLATAPLTFLLVSTCNILGWALLHRRQWFIWKYSLEIIMSECPNKVLSKRLKRI